MSPTPRTPTRAGVTLATLALALGCAEAPRDRPDPVDLSVGEMHNLGMAAVLDDLQRAGSPLDRPEALERIRTRLDAFAAERGLTPMTDDDWRIGLLAAEHAVAARPAASLATATLAPTGEDLMWRLQRRAVVAPSAVAVAAAAEDVLREARGRLGAVEMRRLEEVASVAAASAVYWERDGSGWLALCSAHPGLCGALGARGVAAAGPNGWATLAADVTGAILGGPWAALIASTVAMLAST